MVEGEVVSKTAMGILSDAPVATFLSLKPADKLKWIIHARKFRDGKFHAASLTSAAGKLNKTVYQGQTAADISSTELKRRQPLLGLVGMEVVPGKGATGADPAISSGP